MSSYKAQYKSSGSLRSPKYVKKQRSRRRRFVSLCIFLCIALVVAILLFVSSSVFEINSVVVKGSSTLAVAGIQEKVLSVLHDDSQKIAYGLIPEGNIFFVPKAAIVEAIRADFKNIDAVSVARSGLKQLTLTLGERVPAATVCFGFRDENASSSDCYETDIHGYIFAIKTIETDDTQYYVPTDTGTSPLGTTFIDEKRLKELENFVHGARAAGLSPLGILVGDAGQYEMYMKNKKGDSEVTVYFDDKAPFENTLSNLLAFWQNPSLPLHATSTPAFDYINLRFGNAVYYSTQ